MSGVFDGHVVVVTGGASGIGLATSQLLASQGGTVVVLDVNPDDLPAPLTGIRCDIRDRASVDAAMSTVSGAHGRIDVLVNNAGIGAVGTVEEATEEEWERVFDINVFGMARVSAAALPLLRESEHPAIVNVCSVSATSGLPQRAVYSSSKGAVYGLTIAMATDHVREGIRVNCVNPGTVNTPFVDRNLQKFPDPVAERAALDARQPTGRMVSPDEVAGAIAYLASPLSGSTTGTALAVDGGMDTLRVRPH